MDNNRPVGREKRVTGQSSGVKRRGDGLGTGPVGGGPKRPSGDNGNRNGRGSGGGKSPLLIVIALIVLLMGGGSDMLSSLLGDDGGTTTNTTYNSNTNQTNSNQTSSSYSNSNQTSSNYSNSNQSGSNHTNTNQSNVNTTNTAPSYSASQKEDTKPAYYGNSSAANTSTASDTRSKYTKIKGNGKDTTTIMVYMCGTDLESKSGMATNDLKEMASASFGDQINLIVYTGGCRDWKIRGISTQTNQIYQIKNGNMYTLESDIGNKIMTSPATLTEFILYCKKNFPANRNDLIFWDHGGGSVTGYGYDEKRPNAGAMNLSAINKALSDADMKFDFIGFDACLMAGVENAKMLEAYADYMIASEETEPGIGWYYTSWLNAYGKNPSMDTVSIGKNIIDGFVDDCNRRCRGQLTTLSLVDLAEFVKTVPPQLKTFSKETADLIKNQQYRQVATARQGAREFATSTRIDQVDLVDLAKRINTPSSASLIKAIQSCVKYNRTSYNMTDASGLSVYFPNRKLSSVDNAVAINSAIGMDEDFNRCIKEYASLQLSGQAVSAGNGNSTSPFDVLFGGSSYSGSANNDMTQLLLEQLFGGSGYDFLGGRSLNTKETASYIYNNQFDASALKWQYDKNKTPLIDLPEEQWDLVTDVVMTMYYDDGTGYVDLGQDNLFSFDEYGRLQGETDHTWLSIDGQPVAYYYEGTMKHGDDYTITGYVPAFLNGTRVNLQLVFDQDNPYGYISGAITDYVDGETDTIAKVNTEIRVGDQIDFLCDYYDYDGNYQDSYFLGDPIKVTEDLFISNEYVGDGDVFVSYRFTDIYNNTYWTPVLN